MFSSAMKPCGTRRNATVFAASLFALLFAVLASPTALALNTWQVSISEKELKLENPVDMMWDKWLMWDIGYQRMIERNMPYIELLNEAESTSPITEFNLTIGDNRFNFGPVENASLIMLGSTTPGFAHLGDHGRWFRRRTRRYHRQRRLAARSIGPLQDQTRR